MGTVPASENVFPLIRLSEAAAPATPPTGQARLYVKSDGILYWKDDAGNEYPAGAGAAADVSIADAGGYFTGTDVEAALQELGGAGGGATIDYGSLKPATPDIDFDSPLSGWTAHSVSGSFAIGQCRAQALDGSHLRIGYKQAQRGLIYRTIGNTDLDIIVGGLRMSTGPANAHMPGIAVLNSSGTGVGIVQYNDNKVYLANITTWAYASALATGLAGYGHDESTLGVGEGSELYLRLQRVTNTWTASLSIDGNSWNEAAFGSGSATITADRFAIGNWLTNIPGVLWCDFVDGV